ncbi:MAG: aldo/keto reductase [Microbacteriaceae bacterium]
MSIVPNIVLNSGHSIPQLGFGLYRVDPEEAERVVLDAFEVGYRHIDGAALYNNEEGFGRAIAKSGIAREELFITTKLWKASLKRENALADFETSLDKLGLDYVDLYLIHWPAPKNGLYVEGWLALEEIAVSGRARSIGVSNFEADHLQDLLDHGSVVPAVNQVELHPLFQQSELRAFQESHGIRTESWGPLGHASYSVTEIPLLVELGNKYGKSAQQITIRWQLQEGIILFPKTMSKARAAENFNVFDFELSADEMGAIRALNENRRVGKHPNENN